MSNNNETSEQQWLHAVCNKILPNNKSNDKINHCKPKIATVISEHDIQQQQLCNSISSPINTSPINFVDSTEAVINVNISHDTTFTTPKEEDKMFGEIMTCEEMEQQ
mmetsp:Transcript_3228/g.4540  ORF Transcript_3228/g.4540 Transcript_3228/m.4540 type:complete len:107 (-) Transcript_3228:372-692(-)